MMTEFKIRFKKEFSDILKELNIEFIRTYRLVANKVTKHVNCMNIKIKIANVIKQ